MEGALGAITGLVGAGLSYSAQQTANVINMMNLRFQQENARKQLRFAKAGRQDQFGNETKFDEGTNEWLMNLTPMQRAIAKATENEQYLSLTEDAKRRREIQREQRKRGQEAKPDYDRVLADFRYNQPKSELAIRDELTNLLAGVTNEKANASKTELMRQALREGQGANIPLIIKGVNDDSGTTLAENMLKARSGAQQEFAARTSQHNQTDLPILQQLQQLMDMGGGGGGGGGIDFSPGKALGDMQQQGSSAIAKTLQNEASNVGAAYKNLAASSGKSPNFAGIAKSLGQGQKKQQGQQPDYGLAMQDYYDDLEADRFTNSYGDF